MKSTNKCARCNKDFHGAQYREDYGWICERCFDEECEEEKLTQNTPPNGTKSRRTSGKGRA